MLSKIDCFLVKTLRSRLEWRTTRCPHDPAEVADGMARGERILGHGNVGFSVVRRVTLDV